MLITSTTRNIKTSILKSRDIYQNKSRPPNYINLIVDPEEDEEMLQDFNNNSSERPTGLTHLLQTKQNEEIVRGRTTWKRSALILLIYIYIERAVNEN